MLSLACGSVFWPLGRPPHASVTVGHFSPHTSAAARSAAPDGHTISQPNPSCSEWCVSNHVGQEFSVSRPIPPGCVVCNPCVPKASAALSRQCFPMKLQRPLHAEAVQQARSHQSLALEEFARRGREFWCARKRKTQRTVVMTWGGAGATRSVSEATVRNVCQHTSSRRANSSSARDWWLWACRTASACRGL